MWETTVIESRVKPRKKSSPLMLASSLSLHGLAALGLLAATFFEPFPSNLPREFASYRLALTPPLPPPPPRGNPLPRSNVRRTIPPPDVAPTMIPETIPIVPAFVPAPEVAIDPTAPIALQGTPDGVDGGISGGVGEAPPPPPVPGAPVIVARDAKLPNVALSQTYPQYPENSRLKGVQGSVIVRYRIGKNGRVMEVEVLHHSQDALTRAAVNAISHWRFKPLMVNGAPVEVVHELTVVFQLS